VEHPLLSIQNVSKLFGSNYALKNVTFHVKRAECLAVVGENGAGKSTLMKILSGVWPYESYEGHILLQGRLLQLKSPMDGWKNGISIIHQELCLFPELTVAENIFLLEEFPYQGEPSKRLWRAIHWKTMTDQAEKLFAELGFSLDPHTTVRKLSVAGRQLVEIARAFHHRAKLVILDEPTSALSSTEISQLFEIIRRMSSSLSFIYISHKLDEIFTLCQRIVILRDGHSVAECDTEKVSPNEIVHHMVGRAVQFTKRATTLGLANPILSLSNLCHRSRFGKKILDQISFNL